MTAPANAAFNDEGSAEYRSMGARARRVRERVIRTIHATGEGHYGGSLSMADLLVVLYGRALDRRRGDRFILSKGHGAPAYYATLVEFDFLEARLLERYGQVGSPLQGHPDMTLHRQIAFSTGSLGQGLSAGLGMALVLRAQSARVWVMLGDGECQEGQVWEAAQLAARLGVTNLTAIVDANGHQEFGFRSEGSAQPPVLGLVEKWRAFGWTVFETDGHNHRMIENSLRAVASETSAPSVLIANTRKGAGVPLIERDPDRFHCGHLSAAEYELALESL